MITLVTTVYEKDYQSILNKEGWFYTFNHPFITQKTVLINNISNVEDFLKLKISFQDTYEFYESKDYVDAVNKKFNVNIKNSDPSYFYSIQHFSALVINTDNEYIFYVGPDCTINCEDLTTFFNKSIEILKDDDLISTTIFWSDPNLLETTGKHEESSTIKRTEDFYTSKIFSDQVYFSKFEKLKNVDYTNTNQLHEFPPYGINSFEFRLTNYLITNNKYRGIYKNKCHYIHKSF